MRIAHLADLHLGHRRYAAVTATGRNHRQQDVTDAFTRCIEGILASDVQLVLVAGDVFDFGRPHVSAVADAMAGVQRLVRSRIIVVIVSGNHDEKGIMNSGETGVEASGSPLRPLALVGAKVVRKAERVSIPSLKTHILCVPESDVRRVKLVPGTEPGTQLLLAHGRFNASLYRLPEAECLTPDDIHADFVHAALGDFHRCTQVAPNAWYAGSTEYTSSNPWSETAAPAQVVDEQMQLKRVDEQHVAAPKGWLLVDTDAATVELRPIPTRAHIDLPRFSATDLDPKAITAKVLEQLAAHSIESAVVRQVVTEIPRGYSRYLDARAIRSATKTCLHFQLDERRPEVVRTQRALVPGVDMAPDEPPEGFASWEAYDAWLTDDNTSIDATDPTPADDFSIADAFQAGAVPLIDVTADPYHLNGSARSSAAA